MAAGAVPAVAVVDVPAAAAAVGTVPVAGAASLAGSASKHRSLTFAALIRAATVRERFVTRP